MARALGIVVALSGSLAGTALLWYGGGNTVLRMSQYGVDGGSGGFPALAGLGAVLLGVAAFSVRWSSLGVLIAGGAHLAFSLLALLVPTSTGGAGSPAIALLDALVAVDPGLASGGFYVVAFGASLLIGAALLGVGAVARRRAPNLGWRIASGVGGVLAIGAAVWAFTAGGSFYRSVFQLLDWQLGPALAVTLAGAVFGLALLPAGRSPIGAWLAGPVLALVGVVLLVVDSDAYADAPNGVLATLPVLGWSGAILAVGLSVTGLALGVTLRPVRSAGAVQDRGSAAV
ncbi:hypothetical protein [Protaetiibacter mangrovi]|uniref:Uncharacterized protein n=1 Tax=Protaetiibacter mangrovi TaxID=2970926 RepID=A0ABT1ZFB8_9MICO|nr:hypothetical protein [Protaetiibacter mangrovi]MCS0499425.1 hypothetical protein [Protaetiibacter mangrovi]